MPPTAKPSSVTFASHGYPEELATLTEERLEARLDEPGQLIGYSLEDPALR